MCPMLQAEEAAIILFSRKEPLISSVVRHVVNLAGTVGQNGHHQPGGIPVQNCLRFQSMTEICTELV
jgi:hypothetical protein